MNSSKVFAVYALVAKDVINKLRQEFIASGTGEAVLEEIQALWEVKMMQCGIIDIPIENFFDQIVAVPAIVSHNLNVRDEGPDEESKTLTMEMMLPSIPSTTPLPLPTPLPGFNNQLIDNVVAGSIIVPHDLNVRDEDPDEESKTLIAEMLFPPKTPSSTPLPLFPLLPGVIDQSIDNVPTTTFDCAPSHMPGIKDDIQLTSGRPISYMQPSSSWMEQRPLGIDINEACFDEGGTADRGTCQHPEIQDISMMSSRKRKLDDDVSQEISMSYLPQQDGNREITLEPFVQENLENQTQTPSRSKKREIINSNSIYNEEEKACGLPSQQDGVHAEYDMNLKLFQSHRVANEDHNTPGHHVELQAPTHDIGTQKPGKSEASEDDEPLLNEEDDDDDDDSDKLQLGDDAGAQNLVLALFEKVTRTKSKWKCILKNGIMYLNSRDILFNEAKGEFHF